MSHFFVICETGDRKFIKRVFQTIEDCHAYFSKLLQEIQSKPETYRVLHHSNIELTIEELDKQGQASQRKYTTVKGEVADVVRTIGDNTGNNTDSLI